MSKVAAITDFLTERRASFVSSFRIDESAAAVFLEIPVNLLRSKAGRGFTSRRQLSYLRRDLAARFGLRGVLVLRVSQELTDLESGLRALLVRKFPTYVSDFYMSFPTGADAQAWVVLKQSTDDKSTEGIRKSIREFLAEAKLSIESLEFLVADRPEPSIPAILRSVKALSPADIGAIVTHLGKRGFGCPSDRWMAGRLDLARKHGFLVRDKRGHFVLTALGLDLVPHTRSRSSTDVERMLLLARRKQW